MHPSQRALVVSQVIGIFKRLWGDSWGPRLENLLRNSLFALVEQPTPVSIAAVPKLLTDPKYRKQILANITKGVVASFFRDEYDGWKDSFREEAVSPVLNKIRAFLTDPLLLTIVGQAKSRFDFRWLMDNRPQPAALFCLRAGQPQQPCPRECLRRHKTKGRPRHLPLCLRKSGCRSPVAELRRTRPAM